MSAYIGWALAAVFLVAYIMLRVKLAKVREFCLGVAEAASRRLVDTRGKDDIAREISGYMWKVIGRL